VIGAIRLAGGYQSLHCKAAFTKLGLATKERQTNYADLRQGSTD
jgi:hypothetical protein